MDFTFSLQQCALEEKCRQFAMQEIAPHLPELEEDHELRQVVFKKMARAGLFLLGVAPEHGGSAIDVTAYLLALRAIAQVDAGIAVAMAVTNMVAEVLDCYGTAKQREKYFSKIASGEYVPLSFALTEKTAGSDAKSMQMQAIQDPEDSNFYLLEGEKRFITNADRAGIIVVMAKTDEAKGSHGITAFLVARGTPGLEVTKVERKLGLLSANLVNLRFTRCRVHVDDILGKKGAGFSIAMSALDSGRLGIAAQATGIAQAALQAAIDFSKQREQFGRRICDNQAIAFKLADMHLKLTAAQLLLFKAASLKESKLPFSVEASQAKLYATEMCNEVANDALQIHGGCGYTKDYPAEKYFRDARATTLYEGTSEIQRLIIARHLLAEDAGS